MCIFFFFFNDTATTEIYTLSLHDALPILVHRAVSSVVKIVGQQVGFSKVFRAEFDLWDVLWIGLAISAAWRIASKSSWTQHAATVEEEQAARLVEERRRRQEEVRRARGEEPSK